MRSFLVIAVGILCISIGLLAQNSIDTPGPPLPDIGGLGLVDVIDILTEFHVTEDSNPFFCRQLYALTDFQARLITLCGTMDITLRRQALLHELRHIQYWKRGIFTGGPYEPTIESQVEKIFRTLYGIEPINPHATEPPPEPHTEK